MLIKNDNATTKIIIRIFIGFCLTLIQSSYLLRSAKLCLIIHHHLWVDQKKILCYKHSSLRTVPNMSSRTRTFMIKSGVLEMHQPTQPLFFKLTVRRQKFIFVRCLFHVSFWGFGTHFRQLSWLKVHTLNAPFSNHLLDVNFFVLDKSSVCFIAILQVKFWQTCKDCRSGRC